MISSIKYILSLSLVSILFAGCSSFYNIQKYSSKEIFIEQFNKSVKDKNVTITLTNDSSFSAYGSSIIVKDSLSFVSQIKEEIKIEPGEIKNIKYYGNSMTSLSAEILLKDGKVIKAENVSLLSDSSIKTTMVKDIFNQLPLFMIKEVSYKNHWLGIPGRFLMGTATGIVLGLTIGSALNDNTQGGLARSEIFFLAGPSIGSLVGIVWGYLDGYNYIYQFNP